ncbi:glutamyl-tRNA amidotransferase [Platysternon megacephalum]|uniref:Glutamyl-tRNA amidotransferase n=1 Tax=Platysternon megacephalum TaxID=55544 RepID=A0A4D9DG95_9SAUR|nr:glutamyl-tRNA amidotransferase [Platysternon megacephalum]
MGPGAPLWGSSWRRVWGSGRGHRCGEARGAGGGGGGTAAGSSPPSRPAPQMFNAVTAMVLRTKQENLARQQHPEVVKINRPKKKPPVKKCC